jgi:hypothetical protein
MTVKKSQAGIWIFAPDIHSPDTDWATFYALQDYIDKTKLRGFVKGGDQLDNKEISHHNRKRIIFREVGSYSRNTKFYDSRILKPIEASLDNDTERVWIEGNHDDWENQLVDENPELQGTVERRILLDLAARDWRFVPLGKGFRIGKCLAIHGETLTGIGNQAGKYPSATAVDKYAQSVIHGHVHTMQCFTKVLPHDVHEKWAAYSSPVLAKRNPGYAKNKPNAVVNGFSIIEVSENKNFNAYPVVVTDGVFRFGGKEYGKLRKK